MSSPHTPAKSDRTHPAARPRNPDANARRALAMARPFSATSPAIAAFCRLLTQSLDMPPRPMALQMPPRGRKGGARARRLSL